MITVGLYIDNTKADMFEDVSITFKDSIKKAADIGSMFTSHTQQFRLPASKTNNIIFAHYYDFKIIKGGFDGRRKHIALLTLNGGDFQKGYIKLNSVQLKDNLPKSYAVQFFGEMTTLKDKFGEDLIEELSYLNRFNHTFNIANVRGGFETSLKYNSSTAVMDIHTDSTGEIIYPFITHTKGFAYHSTYGLRDVFNPTTGTRLDYIDLKPALKIRTILTAIESKYNLTFAGDFINESLVSTSLFDEIYVWCHKVKGGMETDDPATNVAEFTFDIKDIARTSYTKDPSESLLV